jgi:hypothetical protein
VKPITEQSLYEILEIPRDAPVDEIEKAYQRAKALYGPGSLATYSLVAPEEMALLNRRIEEAHSVLLDAGARAGYDAGLPGSARSAPPRPAAAPAAEPAAPAEAPPAPPLVETAAPAPAPEAPPAAHAEPGGGAAAPPAAPAAKPAVPGPAPAAPAAEAAAPAPSPPPPAAKPSGFAVPDGTPWTGELLRQAREARGLTLHQIAERTKVTRHHLENVEADRYDLLPAAVYLRGILISLAKELRLDPQKVSRSYLELVQAAQAPQAPPKPR